MTPATPDPPPVSPDPWKGVLDRIQSRAMVAGQCSVEEPDNPRASMAAAEAEFLSILAARVDAARAADAALLRERDAQIASLTAQVEQQKRAFEDECGRHEQTLIGKRGFADLVAQLGAERDAAQQEIAEQQRDYAILSKMMARETEMLRDEAQENTTLRETLQAAWCELIQHDDQPWVKTLAGQVRVVGLFAFPRPQESQP